jgi:hypothetical protein
VKATSRGLVNHPVPLSYPTRSALVLTWASIVAFALGGLPLLYFWITAEWGKGGEIGGMALIAGALFAVGALTVCSLVGLTLAVFARRFGASTVAWRFALGINALAISGVLVLVLLNLVRARSAG